MQHQDMQYNNYPDDDLILSHIPSSLQQKITALQLFNTLDSTNTYVLNAIKKGADSGLVCIAKHQTAGRGRHERTWLTEPGSALCLSLSWAIPAQQLPGADSTDEIGTASIAVGKALIQALADYGITQGIQMKQPNDILWQGQKLAGILIETTSKSSAWAVGVGLNFNLPTQLRNAIEQPCTDIETITQRPADRNRLTGLVLNRLLELIFQKS